MLSSFVNALSRNGVSTGQVMTASMEDSLMKPVDLKLPKNKKPTPVEKFIKDSKFQGARTVADIIGPTYAIGSSSTNEEIYYDEDLGLFPAVYEAWKNHWNLRTSPDDWWYYVACRIAKAVDTAAKPEKDKDGKVRKMFVDHEGKQAIAIGVNVNYIDEVDYDTFFDMMGSEITNRIKLPAYATTMQSDFTTSTGTHRVASQINLMASMQQFFSYEMMLCGCGIKAVEMAGTQDDWDNLLIKFTTVRKQLEPIMDRLDGLGFCYTGGMSWTSWWDHVEHVFRMLAKTYSQSKQGQTTDKDICDFWAGIFMVGEGWTHGPSGMRGHKAEAYNGWFVQLLFGTDEVLVQDFFDKENKEKMKGLNSVPMTISMTYMQPPITDECTLTAGLMGFQIHDGKQTFNGVPSVQPHHMWAMKLPPCSKVRRPRK